MNQKSSPLQTWSVIILCYNEKGVIARVIKAVIKVLEKISRDYQLIIIDDGSSDGSRAEIKKTIKNNHKIKLIINPQNIGIGRSLYKGYRIAEFENVCFIPGDGQFDICELLSCGKVPKHSIISFYRVANRYYTNWRNILSYINKLINKYVLGLDLYDINWVKVYKLEDLKMIDIELRSSLIESEICAKLILSGIKIKQTKSQYLARTYGVSKGVSLKIVSQALIEIIKLIYIVKKFQLRSAGKFNKTQ